MTNNNFKNSKTKTAITILAVLTIGLALLSPTTIMSHVNAQKTTSQNNPISLSKITDKYLLSITPSKLSDIDMAVYKSIIMKNTEVKGIINGKPYHFGSVGFIGNVYQPNATWYPEIHITVEVQSNLNKDIAIVFDPATKLIKNIQTVGYNPQGDENGGSNHAWSTQRTTGNSGTPVGILANMTAITFTWDGNNRNGYGNVLMLNGLMSGSNLANVCSSGGVPSTYWAQIGFYWEDSGKINWDDTNGNCNPAFPTSPGYASNVVYQFRIVGATSGWAYYAIRSDTGATFTTRGPAVNSAQMSVSSSNDGTSVFYENKYLSTDPSWYGQYGANPPAYNAQYETSTSGPYNNWSSTTRIDEPCNASGNVYPYNSNEQVMQNGNLASGGLATWSVGRMQSYYPAC